MSPVVVVVVMVGARGPLLFTRTGCGGGRVHCGNVRTHRCGLFNINSARKMPSAEGALRKLARALVIERKKIRKDVFKGSEE